MSKREFVLSLPNMCQICSDRSYCFDNKGNRFAFCNMLVEDERYGK